MPVNLTAILVAYGGFALLREFLTIQYYRCVFSKLAGSAAILSFLIEIVDLFVLSTIVLYVIRGGNFLPALVYAFFGSIGVYLGTKFKK